MEQRYWQYHSARVQRGRDLADPAHATLTTLGFNGWEAYAVQPDLHGADDWIIFLKREVSKEIAEEARRPKS